MYDVHNPTPVEVDGWYPRDLDEAPIEAHTLRRCGVTEEDLDEVAIGEVFCAQNGQWFIKMNSKNVLRVWSFI